MKKLFLRDGKLWAGEFPDVQTNAMSVLSVLNECEAAVSAAKDSAVEVVNWEVCFQRLVGSIMHPDGGFMNGAIRDIPQGWTVEIEYYVSDVNDATVWQIVTPELYEAAKRHPESGRSVKQEARLIPLKEPISRYQDGEGNDLPKQSSGIAAQRPSAVSLVSEYFNGASGDTVQLYDVAKFLNKLFDQYDQNNRWPTVEEMCSTKSVSPPPQESQEEAFNEIFNRYSILLNAGYSRSDIEKSLQKSFTVTRKP